MKLTKKKIKELQTKGKSAGLFEDLSLKEIDELKLPYIREGVIIQFPKDIDKKVIKSSIENSKALDNDYSIITTIDKTSQWIGEVDSIKILDDSTVICNLMIMDKVAAVYIEENKEFILEPVLKFKGSKTKYFNFESFMLLKKQTDVDTGAEAEIIEEKPVVADEYVLKVDYEDILTEFEKLKQETIKAIKSFESKIVTLNKTIEVKTSEIATLNDKFKVVNKQIADKNMVLKIKEDTIARFQSKVKESEMKVAKFETQIKQEISSKKQARFNEIFKNYCSAYNIAENDFEQKRKELSSIGEDALEIINSDALKIIGNFNETEENIGSLSPPFGLL